MGRPLKIAKAQTVLTVTDTATTGSIVTISGGNLTTAPTVGIIEGMSFVVASNISGLNAGTTYYVDTILSNTTFSVSTTQLSVQPRVMASLSNSSGGTVKASFAVVDAWFNNPEGGAGFPSSNANTWGVVGGNTAIVGKQILCNVAFGVAGTGTVFASTSSNIVTGYGTDFANLATGTTLYALWGDGTGTPMNLGVTTATAGNLLVAVANCAANGVIGTSGNAQTLVESSPVVFDASFGTLVAGTTYWVKTIANAAAFTVSTAPGGAVKTLSANASVTANAIQQQVVLTAVSSNNATGATSTGDGFVSALHEAGYIVRQKGKTKYLVQGGTSGILGQAYTANVANSALQPNTMNILSTDATPATAYVSSVNDYNSELFPTQVDAGSLVAGTTYTIYSSGDTNWTAVGSASNMTGVTFVATAAGSGTGTAVAYNVNPDVIATFNTAYAANTYDGQPNPIVIIASA